jgi:transcriptional regulator with XRE-family HTH domain
MNFLAENIRHLRKQKQMTQADLANKLGVNRSLIGAYEEGRSEPRLKTVQTLCMLFKVDYQQILAQDLANEGLESNQSSAKHITGEKLRILPIAVDEDGIEQISLVPQKAAAGYTQGFADVEFIEALRTAKLPFPELAQERTYRIFQIEGDSMLPIVPGTYLLGEYLENWRDLKDGNPYVVLTANDGVVFKRVFNEMKESNSLRLVSDNQAYSPYKVPTNEVLEIWYVRGTISFELPDVNTYQNFQTQELIRMMDDLKVEVRRLGDKVDERQA